MTSAWLATHCFTCALVGLSSSLGRKHACTSSFRSGCRCSGAPDHSTLALQQHHANQGKGESMLYPRRAEGTSRSEI